MESDRKSEYAWRHGVAVLRTDASRIITIFELPGQAVANAVPRRYRVLYRKA